MRPLIALLVVTAIATGCAGPEVGAAPDLELGRDICEACGMIISDERFAAGYVDDDGDHVFDDVGDLLEAIVDRGQLGEVVVWVHDRENPRWIEGETAHFVRGTGIRSPMEFGIASFAEHAPAMAYAEEVGGALLTWADLTALAETGDLRIHDHHDHDTGGDDHDH